MRFDDTKEEEVEDRRLVGRPRKKWVENVEADMAYLEINIEDLHDREKCRKNVIINLGYEAIIIYAHLGNYL